MRKALATPPGKRTKHIELTEDQISEVKERRKASAQEKKETAYISLRREAYPDIGDQLDAIWKELNYRRMQGDELTQEADDILNKILAVKKKHPKPKGKKK